MFRHQLQDDYKLLTYNTCAYYQAQVHVKVGDAVVTSWPTLDRYGLVRGVDDETCLVDYGDELKTYPLWWTSAGHVDGRQHVCLMVKLPPPSEYKEEIYFECL